MLCDCKITTGSITEFQALKNDIKKAAIITSLIAGIKTRKNIENSLAPSILADLIISLEIKSAFCLNKYIRNGIDNDTITTAKNVFNSPNSLNSKKEGINNVASGMYIAYIVK